ncbi:rhodanese-like domain-containing protein [Alisedimentitalea sp. MJ-SS2]|uniref:rhodanese-like domain-containing protein n=1 Tax=Aliisedimentitalea sp. MJ-SS2 TaxID=3049795 RepID=UPI00290A00CA|nr:rhodanese-like domain-containing protein [Alisedimentitalea sp. MJ-SS2]MDU8929157.1 rhodanese-like domain-containing protein [Alisedimentitalea sp. MJ-SS2]
MFGLFGGGGNRINPEEAVKGAGDGSMQLIDIREMNELAVTGKAKGAKHIPMMQMTAKCDPRHPEFDKTLDTEKPLVVYCATGARSSQAARYLTQMGFKDVRNLGGLHDWVRGGGATERA